MKGHLFDFVFLMSVMKLNGFEPAFVCVSVCPSYWHYGIRKDQTVNTALFVWGTNWITVSLQERECMSTCLIL